MRSAPRSRWRSPGCRSQAARRPGASTSSTGSRPSSASASSRSSPRCSCYSVWKFRAGPDDDSDGPADPRPHEARDRLDGDPGRARDGDLDRQRDRPRAERPRGHEPARRSRSTARQFAWKFTYPNGKSYGYLTLPKDRHVKLDITADDVIHSFWVPQLSQKQDAVPGQHNSLVDHARRASATYPVICTELCGLGHALMRSHVDIVSPAEVSRSGLQGGGSASTGPPGPRRVPAERLRRLPHASPRPARAARSGPDLDNLTAGGDAGEPRRARSVHQGVDRQAGGLPRARATPMLMPHIFGTQISARQAGSARAVSGAGSRRDVTDIAHAHDTHARAARSARAGIA